MVDYVLIRDAINSEFSALAKAVDSVPLTDRDSRTVFQSGDFHVALISDIRSFLNFRGRRYDILSINSLKRGAVGTHNDYCSVVFLAGKNSPCVKRAKLMHELVELESRYFALNQDPTIDLSNQFLKSTTHDISRYFEAKYVLGLRQKLREQRAD